jgi:hypothetical protein
MHHYDEDAVQAWVTEDGFRIELENHVSGATITVLGPLRGVFEDPEQQMDEASAMQIGQEFAQMMRVVTGESALQMRRATLSLSLSAPGPTVVRCVLPSVVELRVVADDEDLKPSVGVARDDRVVSPRPAERGPAVGPAVVGAILPCVVELGVVADDEDLKPSVGVAGDDRVVVPGPTESPRVTDSATGAIWRQPIAWGDPARRLPNGASRWTRSQIRRTTSG